MHINIVIMMIITTTITITNVMVLSLSLLLLVIMLSLLLSLVLELSLNIILTVIIITIINITNIITILFLLVMKASLGANRESQQQTDRHLLPFMLPPHLYARKNQQLSGELRPAAGFWDRFMADRSVILRMNMRIKNLMNHERGIFQGF